MRKMMQKAICVNAAVKSAEASSCACFAMNTALILDAALLASIFVVLAALLRLSSLLVLLALLALLLAHASPACLKDLRPRNS